MNHIHPVLRPEFTRLILEQLRDRPMDTADALIAKDTSHPHAATPPSPSLSWEPSATARLLADVAVRNDDKPPTIRVRIDATEPQQIANEVRAAIERSGISYHAQLAHAVTDGQSLTSIVQPAPGPHPFDSATMLAMTGQLHTRVQTPLGDVAIVFHRIEDDPDERGAGYTGKISSASIAVEHPELGGIIAHLTLTGKELIASVRCNASSAAAVEASAPQLSRILWEVGMLPIVNITPLSHD